MSEITNKEMEILETGEDEIIQLESSDGQKVDFIEIAGFPYQGTFYALLQPVELFDGMEDDEVFVFKVTPGEGDEDVFTYVEDDDVIEAVFEEYERLYQMTVGDGEDE